MGLFIMQKQIFKTSRTIDFSKLLGKPQFAIHHCFNINFLNFFIKKG